jgi:para-nitrobenzyl esterase
MSPSNKAVELRCGRLVGARVEGVLRFAGIPYAEPPTGERRFQAPAPSQPWSGTFDASQASVIAPQLPSRLVGVMGDFERTQSEDCLRLTVTTPAADGAKRPVIVWLHGGGFSSGAGGLDWYDGSRLALEGDLVVVGVNYRLGALGYLLADGVSPGNLGLLDQALALRFVRENVAAFGGDPDNITLMGQSAGGNSIIALFAGGHDTRGVRRAILQSAALGLMPFGMEEARRIGADFLGALGIEPWDANARAKALATPVSAMLEAQATVARQRARYGDTAPPFQLVCGNGLPPDCAFHLAAADAMAGIEVLLGATEDEADAFLAAHPHTPELTEAEAQKLALALYGRDGLERYRRLRQRDHGSSEGALFSRLTTGEIFIRPAVEFVDRLLARGATVYLYDFAWKPVGSIFRSCHCIELPFVFGPSDAWKKAPMLFGGDPEAIAQLSAQIRAAWISFSRGAGPAAPNLPQWSAVTPGKRTSMRLDRSSRLDLFGTSGK